MLLYLRLDKNTAAGLIFYERLDAVPLTCCGEERRDSNKALHPVKKNLSEKEIYARSLQSLDFPSFN
jgi:hypothetical protein